MVQKNCIIEINKMKRVQTFILMIVLVSIGLIPQGCINGNSNARAFIEEVETQVEDYDQAPNDSLALQVVTYMEMNGTPEERLRAWRTAGKMYRRMDNANYWAEAYRMAVGSIDTTQVFDTLLLAATLSEYAEVLSATQRRDQARQQSDQAIRLTEEIGDSVHAMYFRAMNYDLYLDFSMAWSGHDYLWLHGERQLAEDCIFPALLHTFGDSCYLDNLNRFAQYTSYNIEHPQSYRARQFWKAKAGAFQMMGEKDSCLYYLRKLANADLHRFEGASSSYCELSYAFSAFGQEDSACYYHQLHSQTEKASFGIKAEKQGQMLEHVYQSMRTQMEQVEEAHRLRNILSLSILLVTTIVIVLGLRQRSLRRQHQELLEQNAEYAALLSSVQSNDTWLDSPIVKRIHEMSSRDAHPSAEEWQQLQTLVETQFPNLFPSLQKEYTLTEQEAHAICLMVSKCTPSQMCVLMIYTRGGISNLRRRLYQKITGTNGNGTDLDKLVRDYARN